MGFDEQTFAKHQTGTPPSLPIAEAAQELTEPWGPVLLWPGDDRGNWRLGRWNGWEWVNDDDIIIYPAYFALVPPVPRIRQIGP